MNRLVGFFVRTFENDRRRWRRAAAGAGVGLAIGLSASWEGREAFSRAEVAAVVVGLTLLFGLGASALATADEVRRRARDGERIEGWPGCCSGWGCGRS